MAAQLPESRPPTATTSGRTPAAKNSIQILASRIRAYPARKKARRGGSTATVAPMIAHNIGYAPFCPNT